MDEHEKAHTHGDRYQTRPKEDPVHTKMPLGGSIDLGVPSGRITDILNGRRAITADTALRLGRYFSNRAQFWLDLQSQYDIAVLEAERGKEIARRVRPADAA